MRRPTAMLLLACTILLRLASAAEAAPVSS
jgi:hypothetical protein